MNEKRRGRKEREEKEKARLEKEQKEREAAEEKAKEKVSISTLCTQILVLRRSWRTGG